MRQDRQRLHRVGHHVAVRVGALDVLFELAAELADRVLDRPGGAVGQAADRGAGHDADRVADLQQQVEILQPALAGLDAVEHRRATSRSFAAGRALAAAFVGEEAADVVQEVDDRHGLVEHDHGRRPRPRQPTRPASKSSGVSNSASVKQAHADAAGNGRLGLATLPHAAAVLVDQLPAGDAQRQLEAARLVHVAAEAIELRPVAAGIARVLGIGRHADRLEPVDAAIDDVRDAARVSMLLTTVGLRNTPSTAGNGGLIRGQARLPSRLSIRPVSSPQM